MESAQSDAVSQSVSGPMDVIRSAVASGLGFGYAPLAPGTAGTLPAVAIFAGVRIGLPAEWETGALALALVVSCVLSIALGSWAERYWQCKDPRRFVLDEIAGFLLTVLLFRTPHLMTTIVWTFLASRFFDTVKPWPARPLEGLGGGWGILVDDLVASLYAAATLHVIAITCPVIFAWD